MAQSNQWLLTTEVPKRLSELGVQGMLSILSKLLYFAKMKENLSIITGFSRQFFCVSLAVLELDL